MNESLRLYNNSNCNILIKFSQVFITKTYASFPFEYLSLDQVNGKEVKTFAIDILSSSLRHLVVNAFVSNRCRLFLRWLESSCLPFCGFENMLVCRLSCFQFLCLSSLGMQNQKNRGSSCLSLRV